MAVRIVRQPKQIVLLGAPTSAAALRAGHEKAPQALRAAGLVERLQSLGYSVTDMGDDPVATYQPDEESPRARNVSRVVKALEALKPRVEAAVKTGGLPLILTGDCSSALAVIAGVRRYYRGASMVYMDSDADLNIPATSHSGCVDGMVVSHLTGRGAAEMVRFWGEPPLVRDPDVALFGVSRMDPPEEEMLSRFPIRIFRARDIQRMGAVAAAETAIERIHGGRNELVVHLDVDVIASEDFDATDLPGAGGLRLEEVRQALEVFAEQGRLVAFEVAAYNPERDSDGRGARIVVDLIAAALGARIESQAAAGTVEVPPVAPDPSAAPAADASSTPDSSSADVDDSSATGASSTADDATPDSSSQDAPEEATSASGE
ncbi:MAG: arginase family protein [Candidatus Acidiferrales bacterium]